MQNVFMRHVVGMGIVFCIVACVLVILTRPAESAPSDNLSGYAWSDTIGWISMNCTDPGTCGGSSYGVTVAKDGTLTGYAWSEHIGWISFNAGDVAGCPNGTCGPRLDRATGEVRGWARALSGRGSNTGGWDGFISLSGGNYGVRVDGCDWSGYAWGSDVVGWVAFNGHTNDVSGTGHACQGNIVSEGVSVGSGSLTQGGVVTFRAPVRNDSIIPLAFVDTFTYQYAGDSTSTVLSSVSHLSTPLAAGQTATDISGSLSLTRAGILTARHCADDGDRVAEINETDNCTSSNFTIKGGNITAPDCTIPPGSSSCTTLVTWTTAELANPSIQKNAVEVSDTPQNLTGLSERIDFGTYTYSIYDGSTLIAADQARALCANGSSWDSVASRCTGAPPSAPVVTFIGPGTVVRGNPATLTWTVTGPADGCWAMNDGGVTNWNNEWVSVTGGTRPVSPTINPTKFYLECWNQGVSSGRKEHSITVTDPSTAQSATISASECVIQQGASSCNTLVTWTSENLQTPSVLQGGNPFSSQPNSPGGGQVRQLTGTTQVEFKIRDITTGFERNFRLTPTCVGGVSWDPGTGVCDVSGISGTRPSLRANPRIVEEGEDTRLIWDTNGTPETSCILYGGAFGSGGITVPDDDNDTRIDKGSILTEVSANTTYTISCPATDSTRVNVEIIPRYFPI